MSASDSPALSAIRAYRPLGPACGTAGQPSAGQFSDIRAAGFETVINLAMPTSDHALPNEGSLVTTLGMAYVHIPVNFEAPQPGDFDAFTRVLAAFGDRPVFVHCAANMRVSAFMFLHRVVHQAVDPAVARRDLHAIWRPDPVWERFIDDVLQGRSRQGRG